MSLAPGSRIGHYEILAPLGAGGMGEVFRARDTQLQREVALKVLPAALAADPLRVARFRREAQLLAALNHSGIGAIHGLAEADGVLALVLELVLGEDLGERLKRVPLPTDEALDIGRCIAEALEEAHERGIVHRDLKPSNVKVTPDGKVKVLDFGLAKAFSDEASDPANPKLTDSPTLTRQGTQAGMVMGTAAYMSPEQARGKPIDKRTDVWAFGVVLYELLTGRRLFEGETLSDVLAAVLRSELDWAALPADTPQAARRLLERCLERDPKRRLRDIGEARLALEGAPLASGLSAVLPAQPSSGPVGVQPEGRKSRRGSGERSFLAEFALQHPAATVLIVAILAIVATTRRCSSSRPPETARRSPGMKLRVQLADNKPLFDEQGSAAVLSPDGRTAAFVIGEGAKTWLRLRRLDSLEAADVPESGGAKGPFFSPDGQWVGFFARGRLLKAPVTGGAPSELTQVRDARGGAWSSRDVIVFAPDTQGGLMRVPAAGGTPEPLTTLAGDIRERSHRWPSFLPGGGEVLFAVQRFGQEYDESTIETVSLRTRARKLVHKGGAYPRYARSGHLLFARRGVLYAARFDREDQKLEGTPRPVLEGLMANLGNEAVGDGSAQYDVSAAGTLLYRTGRPAAREAQLQVLDAKGAPAFTDERKHVFFSRPRFSPDARRIAVDIDSQPGVHIWVYDLARSEHTRLTFDQNNIVPEWTPDGRFVTFISNQLPLVSTPTGPSGDAIYYMSADGSGAQQLLFRAEGQAVFERSFSPDGRLMAVSLLQEKTGSDIVLLRLDGPLRQGVKVTGPEPLLATEAEEAFPAISPDGKLLAYAMSTNRGDWRVFVRPFPSGEGQREVATGVLPRWSFDGRTLYYQNAGRLYSVAVEARASPPAFGDPREVFDRTFIEKLPALEGFYDVAPDGKRFAVIQFASPADASQTDASHVIVAFDWTEELRRIFENR